LGNGLNSPQPAGPEISTPSRVLNPRNSSRNLSEKDLRLGKSVVTAPTAAWGNARNQADAFL